eukprot:gene45374-57840_t
MTETRPAAIVTGGNTGIGAAIAQRLIERGHDVYCLSRRAPDWSHAKLRHVAVDLVDAEATSAAAAQVVAKGDVGIVVHNAGAIRASLVDSVTMRDLHDLTQLHLGTAIELVQACLPAMKEVGHGRIVLLSSRAALGLQT